MKLLNEKHDTRKHASVSPSKLKNLAICPHYKSSDSTHPTTEMGTRCHDAIEAGDLSNLNYIERGYVFYCLNYLVEQFGAEIEYDDETHRLTYDFGKWSHRFEPLLETHEKETWGYCDLELRCGDEVHIVDWKFGVGWQGDAKNNLQGKAYAVGTSRYHERVERVGVHFVYGQLEKTTAHTFDKVALENATFTISSINRHVEDSKQSPEHNYDKDNCQYCGARLDCPLWKASREATGVALANELGVPTPATFDLEAIEDNPDEMAKVLALASDWEDYFKQAKQWALMMIEERGHEIPGYRVVTSHGKLRVIDIFGVYQECRRRGLAVDQFLSHCTASGPQLAKTIAARQDDRPKATVEREFREALCEAGLAEEGTEFSYLRKI